MANPININEARQSHISNYLVLSLRTEFALGESIALLETRRTLTGDGDETRDITFHIALYEAQRVKIKADRIAFITEQIEIKPPTKSKVERVISLAKELDNMIASIVTTKAILNVTTTLLDLYNDTRV